MEVGVVPVEVPVPPGGAIPEQLPQYLVRNKETGVVEFSNTALYFVRDWANQMTDALRKQDWEIDHPDQVHPDDVGNVVTFPGGGGGKSN